MDFILQNLDALAEKTWEQVYLVGISILLAIVIGVPTGILILRRKWLKDVVLSVGNVIQTIPSLALLVFLLPFLGIGVKPALAALTLYSLLPIIRNTVAGLSNVDRAMLEAADGLGFTRWQKMFRVELPLAMPIIIAGIRTATAVSVGIATLAAFIGAGGLGDFIYQGLSLDNTQLILLGAVPAALLALMFDFLIGFVERRLSTWTDAKHKSFFMLFSGAVIAILLLLGGAGIYHIHSQTTKTDTIRIGSKNFTEQIILGYLMADMIEAKTHLKVEKKFNLGGTLFCHNALVDGEIDLYPEYTGTAYMNMLKFENPGSPQQVYRQVKAEYQKRFHLLWLQPFGFNNTEALAVRQRFAEKNHLKTISDLAPLAKHLTAALYGDCLKRADCYSNLRKVYRLTFADTKLMEPALLYQAIANQNVDVGTVSWTDGRIPAYHLITLKDDKHAFPPYYAAPVIREDTLKKYPQIRAALKPLANLIDDQTMRRLNYEVDVEKKSPRTVARDFLLSKGLITH